MNALAVMHLYVYAVSAYVYGIGIIKPNFTLHYFVACGNEVVAAAAINA